MMNTPKWGRKETIIFPPHSPIYTYGAVFFALILTGMFVYLRFSRGQTPLQQFYTPIYCEKRGGRSVQQEPQISVALCRRREQAGAELATESDVQDGTTAAPQTGKHIPLALSAAARQPRRDSMFSIAAQSRTTSMRRSTPTSRAPSSEAISSATSTNFRSSSASCRCSRSSHSPSARTFAAARN